MDWFVVLCSVLLMLAQASKQQDDVEYGEYDRQLYKLTQSLLSFFAETLSFF